MNLWVVVRNQHSGVLFCSPEFETRQDGRLWARYIPIHQVYKLQGRVMAEHRIDCRRCDKDWKLYFRKLQNRFTYRFVIGRWKGRIYGLHPSESSTTMKDLWVRGILLPSANVQPVPILSLRNINIINIFVMINNWSFASE